MSERMFDPVADDELDLSKCGATDAELKELKQQNRLATLRVLNLAGTFITDGGLAELSDLKGLQELNLNGSKITDAGLRHLGGLTELRKLDINWTDISDTGLYWIVKLTALEMVDLRWTKATIAGRQRLQQRRPRLKIIG